MAGIYRLMHKESVTQANMKISAYDTGSFIDFGDSETAKLVDHLGYLVKIRDSAGRAIQGFAGAAGTAETLSNKYTSDYSSDVNGWAASNGAVAGNVDGIGGEDNTLRLTNNNLNAAHFVYYAYAFETGKLYRVRSTYYLPSTNSHMDNIHVWHGTQDVVTVNTKDSWANVDEYFNGMTGQNIRFYGYDGTAFIYQDAGGDDVFYLKTSLIDEVTTPSATGITIVSSKGGATQSFAAKDASFNYNDASGYTVELWKVNKAVEVDSDAVLNANATLVLTDGSAAWSAAGIDDSAFQDGRHKVAIYDSTNVMVAYGWYQSGGAGNVVSTQGGATQNWTYKGAGSTAGDFIRKIFYVGAS